MFLTEENYYSREANEEYLSVSQYKDFVGTIGQTECEAKAIAKLKEEWITPPSIPMLVGSYVDAHFEGTLDLFRAKHPEIFLKKHKIDTDLKKEFERANYVITRIERDTKFSYAMSGQKQVIMTAELFGAKWKCKFDSYMPNNFITDLKVMQDIRKKFWVQDLGQYVGFIEYWGYDIQAAVYREIEHLVSGNERLPFYIAAADKKEYPDIDIFYFNDTDFKSILSDVEKNVKHILDLKQGKIEPSRCGKCDYCRHTKVLDGLTYYKDSFEG